MFIVVTSGILPLLDIRLFNSGQHGVVETFEPVIISGFHIDHESATYNNAIRIYSIVYIIGLLAFAIRSILGLATLLYFSRRYPREKIDGFTAVILTGGQSPFAFFNLLFINHTTYEKGRLDELIVHEKIHRDQLHSVDLILLELYTILHWFNPIVWLIKNDLKAEHEFLVDEQVIKRGFDKTRYQALLLRSHEGMAPYLANNFNYSILRKRLIMMTKQKSKGIKLNYILAMPILLFTTMILFLNFQQTGQFTTPDVLPEYKAGNDAMYKTIQKVLKYPVEARKANAQGTVYISFTVDENGKLEDVKAEHRKYNLFSEVVVVGYTQPYRSDKISTDLRALKAEGERVVALLDQFKPGLKDSESVSARMTLPITFKLR
ncbi:MAG: M56 family metallopeptidase [Cytophagales bacterium]|nr:M56 family metallopeptidase [Cytophagales bacterium]